MDTFKIVSEINNIRRIIENQSDFDAVNRRIESIERRLNCGEVDPVSQQWKELRELAESIVRSIR